MYAGRFAGPLHLPRLRHETSKAEITKHRIDMPECASEWRHPAGRITSIRIASIHLAGVKGAQLVTA
jgi:hypothetical protein